MNALVDTSVWSLALRRKTEDLSATEKGIVLELDDLVREGRVRIIGLIRQELLSGVRNAGQYEKLRTSLRVFLDEVVSTSDHEAAAQANNHCRTKGIAMTTVDALICSIALSRDWSVFTSDPDFKHYAKVLTIELHSPRE
ncbi:MAG TPA: PIN domain-containing protein [Candidatus Acidoferrum sp.]